MTALSQAPVLSTPETHIFEDPTPLSKPEANRKKKTEQQIWEVYEVERTAQEIIQGRWRKVALQFPDGMVGEGVKVYEALEMELARLLSERKSEERREEGEELETNFTTLSISKEDDTSLATREQRIRLYILADTSYGSCCVDEIAAEHVDAEVVVHYGRACLSPTARLPVIYVFTKAEIDIPSVVQELERIFPSKEEKLVLMADLPAHEHIPPIAEKLREKGYSEILAPEVLHDPSSSIPNRKVPEGVELKDYSLFHIADPPPALLLTLHSRVKELHIYTPSTNTTTIAATSLALRRRYAVLTSLSTCGVFGILINTLSVSSFLPALKNIQDAIKAQGKKYYTFVVGKLNPAKIANFAEIGGWVVVGCWESGLVDMKGEKGDYWRGMITPWELEMLFKGDGARVWDGGWRGDFAGLTVDDGGAERGEKESMPPPIVDSIDDNSEEESEPPEFDLRTGRYVSHSRPMRTARFTSSTSTATSGTGTDPATAASQVLTRRAKGELASVNGAVSPGAEYLRSQRTWTGLGSDFHEEDAGMDIEEGRSGVARGYVVGDGEERR